MREGIDYAWWNPSEAELTSLGAKFVARYLSPDPSKNLTHAEAVRHAAAGRDVAVVWEATADRSLAGRAAGEADAHRALTLALECGMVGGWGIPAAVDFDTAGHPERTDAYFDGWASVLGHSRTGPYGGHEVCAHQYARGFRAIWQTYAWSGGKVLAETNLYQYDNSNANFDRTREINPGLTWRPGVGRVAPSPLDVLLPAEHNLASRYLALVVHNPHGHPHAIAKLKGELVAQRKAVWRAAEKGLTPAGKHTTPGWGHLNRQARYAELLKLTA